MLIKEPIRKQAIMHNFQSQRDRSKIFQAKSLAKKISKEQKHEELRVESSIAQ